VSAMYLSLTPNGGEEFVLVDGPPYRPWTLVSQDWGNPVWEHEFSGPRGTQGARPAQGRLGNRTVRLALRLYGTSATDRDTRLSELAVVMGQLRRHGGYITRRAHGQTYRQHLEVLTTPGEQLPEWDRATDLRWTSAPILEFVCAPYAEGDPMAWTQPFTTEADLATVEVVDGPGELSIATHTTNGDHLDVGSSSQVILLDNLRGYEYGDVRIDALMQGDQSSSDQRAGVVLRYVDADNWLAVLGGNTGSNGYFQIVACVAGSESVLATDNIDLNPGSGPDTTFAFLGWVSGWIEGNTVTGSYRIRAGYEPSPYNEYGVSNATVTATLTTAQAAVLGAGVTSKVGVLFDLVHGLGGFAGGLYELRVQPYFYGGAGRPTLANMPLLGPIPGDAPALTEVAVTTPAANTQPARFALIGWAQRASSRNRCWNGSGNVNTDGWSASAVTGVTAAATSVSGAGTIKSGRGGLALVSTTTDTSGVSFRMYDRFRKGITYRASCYVYQAGNIELCLGRSGDLAVSTPTTFTGNEWIPVEVEWTPTADYTDAYVAVRVNGTGGEQPAFDEVMVVDTSIGEPTIASQQQGRGSHPVLGVIAAQGHEQETGTTDTTVATALIGTAEVASVSGAGSLALSYIIDPALTAADDYTQDELELEVWARINLDDDLVGLRGAVWVNPVEAAYNADTLGARRAAHLWGTTGRPITRPSTTDCWRLVRLGVVPVRVERDYPEPVRLTVSFTWATGSTDSLQVDYLVVCPYRSRCLSPTAVSYDDGGYPEFISTHADEVTKVVRPDLSAVVQAPPARTRYPDHGLGGSLLELPPGDVDLLVVLSDLVPDDPDTNDDTALASLSAAIAVSPTPRWSHLRDA
jgi:hypothetical protein